MFFIEGDKLVVELLTVLSILVATMIMGAFDLCGMM